ncbi:GATA zinc finger domain-containing protein 14-like [Helianthus annuus]|uniref:GATA zinc finger domain-containing protein 14-like n=1 Tax=Helianthus annuus TaxID=4232 RepID=UPI0016532694|nr:GATA zinc finger domain-containing protein 14-like [Helianthus annuus]
MANQNSNQNQNQYQYRSNFNPTQNAQPLPQDQPGGNDNSIPSTPPFRNQNPNNNQRTPQQQNRNRQTSLPVNLDDGYVNSDRRENSDDGGYYDDRVDDNEDWGYINRGNDYRARGYEDEEFGYQNANYVGDDDYGRGNRRNDGYENNRQQRNNYQRNRNDGFYNNNNANPNQIPRFVGGGHQGANRGGNRRDDRRDVGRDERRNERRNERRDDRRDNRRMEDQEVNGPHRRQQPPRGVNDRFRPIVTENDSPIVSFTRFKEMMRRCPHHQIEKRELVKCFVRGLDDNTWNRLESTSNGTLLSNHEDDDWEFLERMSKRSKEKESADRAKKHPISRSLPDLDSKDQISTLEREMARMKKKEVNAVQFEVCEDCGDIGHRAEQCPTGPSDYTEEVNQVNHPNFRYGNASNQMNPNFQSGNQGGQSGLSYQNRQVGNQGGYQRNYNQGYQGRDNNYQGGYQRNYNNQGGNGSVSNNQTSGDDLSAKMDALLNMQKESQNNIKESHNDIKEIKKTNEIRDKAHEALAKQVGQLAEEMAQIRGSMGKLPSDTTVNPKHQGSSSKNTREVHLNEISLRSGRIINSGVEPPSPKFVEGVVEDASDDEDYVSLDRTKQPTVILGRPLLATSNAQINCKSGTVDMTFGGVGDAA